jgi:hypothetical protein
MGKFNSASEFEDFLAANAEGMATDILKAAAESQSDNEARGRQVREAIEAAWPEGMAAIRAASFAMAQHALWMVNRLDEVERDTSDDPHQPVRIGLALLQSNATLILGEIRTLMEAGYWAGAASRWRALHESAVAAKLIAQGGPRIAQRFLDHGYVVQTRRLGQYFNEHGVGPVPEPELQERITRAEELERNNEIADSKYPFGGQYGWAVPLMPLGAKGRRLPPTMDELEKLAELSHRRLLVASSHGLVHGDAAGVQTSVLLGDSGWLLGPTDLFAETVARPTLDTLIHLVAATHLGFEPEFNTFSERLGLVAAALVQVCADGIAAFERNST